MLCWLMGHLLALEARTRGWTSLRIEGTIWNSLEGFKFSLVL